MEVFIFILFGFLFFVLENYVRTRKNSINVRAALGILGFAVLLVSVACFIVANSDSEFSVVGWIFGILGAIVSLQFFYVAVFSSVKVREESFKKLYKEADK